MPINTAKAGGSKRVFRTTDKCVQAEMKNKVETARLQLHKRILDRQQAHHKFTVEKEKRQSLRALVNMRKTSGLSIHGLSPQGPADRDHETSQYFKSYRPLTEKRLVTWRTKESILQRQLEAEEEIVPPWERDPNEDLGAAYGHMMRMLGFRAEDDDLTNRLRSFQSRSADAAPVTSHGSRLDVFECLRAEVSDEEPADGLPRDPRKYRSFPISAWSDKVAKDYSRMVMKPNSAKRVRSAMPRMQSDPVSRNGTADSSSTARSQTRAKVRPHTASSGRRTSSEDIVLSKRPNSACDKLTSRDESQSSASSDDEHDDRDEADEVFEENDPDIQPSISNGAQKIAKSRIARTRHSEPQPRRRPDRALSRTISMPAKVQRPRSPESPDQDSSQPKDSSMSVLKSMMGPAKLKSRVTFSGLPESGNGAPTKKGKVTSVKQLQTKMKEQTKMSDKELEGHLEALSGVGKRVDDMEGVFSKMPQRRERPKNFTLLNKTEKKIALHSTMRQMKTKSLNQVDALDDIMESDEDDDDDAEDEPERRMPQWKRELMAEAPPGLFGPKSMAKVVVAMSKAQRRRELDQLVTDNISDVKKLTEKENDRRIRARLHTFFTMKKLGETVSAISGET